MAKINKNLFGDIAAVIAANMEDESEAIKGYQELLTRLENIASSEYLFKIYDNVAGKEVDSPTAVADKRLMKLTITSIKEYIGEEIKHLKGLSLLYEAMTGIKSDTKH